MAIVGHHPESGVRLVLERTREGGPPWRYEGDAFTATEKYGMRATVEAGGAVRVELDGGDAAAMTEVAEKAKFILRAAYKHAQGDAVTDTLPPPRRIVRWRGEK